MSVHAHIQAWQIRIQAWYYQAYRALDRGLNEGVPRTANHLLGGSPCKYETAAATPGRSLPYALS